MNNQSPGSITLAQVEVAMSQAHASLYLRANGSQWVATVVHGDDESWFSSESMTTAIDEAAKLAGIDLIAAREAVAA